MKPKKKPTTTIVESLSVESLKTDWIGCPMVSNDDPYHPSQAWIPAVEIGLRSDGMVVWRARKPTSR